MSKLSLRGFGILASCDCGATIKVRQQRQIHPRSQTLFGNALGFRNSVSLRATALPGQLHSQTEFGNEEKKVTSDLLTSEEKK
jgi:hypothetical protein